MAERKQVIAFLGLKTSGKDYNAKVYIDAGFKKIALADPLRKMAWNILGYNPDLMGNIPYNEFKNNILFTKENKKILNIPHTKEIEITSIRKILQNLGTECKKLFGEDYWCNLWYIDVINSEKNVVVTDIRFINEINTVLKLKDAGYDVMFIWCQYKGADYKNILKDCHESEMFNQFIYCNREKYGLQDLSVISEDLMKQIIKDYESRIN